MNESYQNIEKALNKKLLYRALHLLRTPVARQTDSSLSDRLQSIENNYHYLTGYFLSGGDDPDRTVIINQLIAEAYRLLDDLVLADNQNSSARRPLLSHWQEKHTGYCSGAKDAFYHFLLTHDAVALTDEWNSLLQKNDHVSLQMALSALTMNILSDFSESLLLLLMDSASLDKQGLTEIALTGCVLCLHKYKERLCFFPQVENRWKLLVSDPKKKELVYRICLRLLSTTLTEQVDKAMNNLQKDILSQQKNISADTKQIVISLHDMEEGNPEWGEAINKVVSKHSEAIIRLQRTGADINYSSTRMLLKEPFFRTEITNWFLPFGTGNKDLGIDFLSPMGKMLLKIIFANAEACSIDQYATCLAIGKTAGQFAEQMLPKELMEMSDEDLEEIQKDASSSANSLTLYIRNLFRFFCHNPWGYDNEMLTVSDVCRTPYLTSCLEDYWGEIGDYCLDLRLFSEAEYIFSLPTLPVSLHLWQKLGYALQKQERYGEAAGLFEKVMTLQDDDVWTLQHLATCRIKQTEYAKAVSLYDKLSSLEPDKTKYILLKAQCLLAMEEYEEALQLFFKLDILAPEEINHQRGLAWCAFLLDKSDVAKRYFEQIAQSGDANGNDFLNYAHCLLVSKQRKDAFLYYRRSISEYGSRRDFLAAFRKDASLLQQKGITLEELRLVEDCLLFA